MSPGREAVLLNPLGAALRHYTAALERLLADCGASARTVALAEPSASGRSRWRWLAEYLGALRRARPREDDALVIQTWPVLGYWDYPLSRLLLGRARALLVLHDPHPLVHAVGYGRAARATASLPAVAARAIVHSNAAAQAVRADARLTEVVDLPHPMLAPTRSDRRSDGQVVIRVLGQYKAGRDVESMERLAAQGPPEWRYEAIGRGWPAVAGWRVRNRFVEEDEFDALIRDSSAIVIPYARFFQSGVAVRSLEMGTPVVGPRSSSLAELIGGGSRWLVDGDGDSWARAIEAAVGAGSEEVHRVASSAHERIVQRWRAWLEDDRR